MIHKKDVYTKYAGIVSVFIYIFVVIRTKILPLSVFDEELPNNGVVIEVGSGHGLISRYLAMSSNTRDVIGFDPDRARTEVASAVSDDLSNVKFIPDYFSNKYVENVDGVVIVGVLCLMSDKDVEILLNDVCKILADEGVVYVSDIPSYQKFDFVHLMHIFRERFLGLIGFTKGDGLYLRSNDEWSSLLERSGLTIDHEVHANVVLHRTYDFVCRKKQ